MEKNHALIHKCKSIKKKSLKNKSEKNIYDTTLTIYPNSKKVEIRQFHEPQKMPQKLIDSTLRTTQIPNENNKGRQKVDDKKIELSEVHKGSLSRSVKTLENYVESNKNDWTSFLTLTFAENITDLTEANDIFMRWRKQYTKKAKQLGINFKYVCVPEFQKRGAVHYHLLTNILCGSELLPNQLDENGAETYSYNKKALKKGIQQLHKNYDVSYWNKGYSSALDLSETDENFNAVKYMCKYMYKDFDTRLYGRNKIMASRNLEKAQKIRMTWDETVEDVYNYLVNNSELEIYIHSDMERFVPNFTNFNFTSQDNTNFDFHHQMLSEILKSNYNPLPF